MGKSPSATPGSASQRLEPAVSVNMTELRGSPLGEDPFSGNCYLNFLSNFCLQGAKRLPQNSGHCGQVVVVYRSFLK